MCKACKALIKAIDGYVMKADSDLATKLKEAGFVLPEETVEVASELEDKLTKVLKKQTKHYLKELKKSVDIPTFFGDMWEELKESDNAEEGLAKAFLATFTKMVPKFTTEYLKTYDKEMELVKVTDRTNYHVHANAEWLSKKMKLDGQTKLETILNNAMDEGSSVQQVTKQILNDGIRKERWQARRVALTEMLRTHSYAADDAIMQSSVVEDKEWIHTGGKNITPRPNHEAMNGVRVHKDEPFELAGADGGIYYPMFPRDTELPAGESVNCHCLHRGVVSKEALGIDVDERRRMQKEYIASMDRAWEKELDEEHHRRAIEWRQERGLKYAAL